MHKSLLSLAVVALLFTGCKKDQDAAAAGAATPAADHGAETGAGADANAAAAKPAGFDIHRVPVSSVALGDFPYIRMPEGCAIDPQPPRHAKAPFWTGDDIHWVAGKTTVSYVVPKSGADCGLANVVANVDSVIAAAGGVKVAEGKITPAAYDGIVKAGAMDALEAGLQGLPNNPLASWVIRRADRQIWLQVGADHTGNAFNFLLSEQAAPQISAGLLPASEMKKQLDAAGKVALQVNFATDKTDVLPDSLAQIEQVAALLSEDASLKLAVNGHTDNSGDAAHNQQLSEGRARAVVALLTGKGIEAARLTAAGFGSAQPVADNGTEEGKAKNRRVELVKR